MRKIVQMIYIVIFYICLIGICGNLELEVETPFINWIVLLITGFLTTGKFVYTYKRNYSK